MRSSHRGFRGLGGFVVLIFIAVLTSAAFGCSLLGGERGAPDKGGIHEGTE